MEFLLLLTAKEKEILNLLYKAEFSVEENTPLCLLGEKFFGFFKAKQKRVVICTDNAKKVGGFLLPKSHLEDDFNKTSIYIRRALRHEAVHVAQNCNNGKPLNLIKNKRLELHSYKRKALEGSTKISGSKEREYEAYWMEDRPELVKYALLKYCLGK